MMIFIDFDDVLFNTKKFKEDFRDMFEQQGIPTKIFDECYVDPNDKRAIKTFNPWLQSERVCQRIDNIDSKYINSCVMNFIENISKYLFDDVLNFAKEIGSENIAIVSFGEKEFQVNKIKNSGVGKFINQIYVIEGKKSEVIKEVLGKKNIESENIFFIDDRTEQIAEVKKELPQVKTIFIKRPEGRYQEMKKEKCCDYEVCSLKEVKEIISNI